MKKRLSPRYIAFLAIMALIIAIGLFMLIYGSLHHTVPLPTLRGPGMYAMAAPHRP